MTKAPSAVCAVCVYYAPPTPGYIVGTCHRFPPLPTAGAPSPVNTPADNWCGEFSRTLPLPLRPSPE